LSGVQACPLTGGAVADSWSTGSLLEIDCRARLHRSATDLGAVRELVTTFVNSLNYLLSQLTRQRSDGQRQLMTINDLKTELAEVYWKQLDRVTVCDLDTYVT